MTRRQLLKLGALTAVAPSLPLPAPTAIPDGWIRFRTVGLPVTLTDDGWPSRRYRALRVTRTDKTTGWRFIDLDNG